MSGLKPSKRWLKYLGFRVAIITCSNSFGPDTEICRVVPRSLPDDRMVVMAYSSAESIWLEPGGRCRGPKYAKSWRWA